MFGELTVHRVVKSCKRAGQYIEAHTHVFFHYIYVLSGRIQVTVGGESFPADQGTLVLVPPGTVHAITSENTSICLDLKFSCSEELTRRITGLPHCVSHCGEQASCLIRGIFDEAVSQGAYYAEMIDLHMSELLLLLLRRQEQSGARWQAEDRPVPPPEEASIRRALALVEERLETPLRVSEIAEECGYSENYFRLFFKKNVGTSPNSYINQRKISRAKKMMLCSDLNITQISERLGYQSIHYFSRLFKKMTGLTPTEYIGRMKDDRPINVIRNGNTPPGEFELPVRSPGSKEQGTIKEKRS